MELNGTVVLRESHGRRVLLICTNVGSIFEDPDVMLRTWVDEITSTIFAHDADFVALHMQEVGGKSFKTGMAMVDSVIQTLRDEPTLNDYDRARFHCYQDFNVLERFTALGALFLVRNSIPEHEIQQWNFAKGEYESMASLVASASTPIPTHSASDYVVEEKFDFNLFPTALKSRKGFQWSRWRIANQQFDVINLHLFHDESNLVSWQKHHGDSGSQYAQSRRLALETMLARCSIGDDEAAFLLGDFNFRLHLYDAVRFLVSDVGADLARRGSFDDPSEATRIVATARDSLPTCEPQHVRDTNSKLTKLVFRGRGGTSTLPAPFETKMSSSSMSIYMGDRSDMANSQGDLSGSADNATPEIVTTDATHTAPVSTTATATVVGVATEKSLKHDVKRGRLDTEDAEVACAADNAARSDLTIPQVDVRAATPHEGSNGTTAEATPVATVVIGEASSDAVYEPGPTRDLSALSVPPKWSRTSSMMSHASETSEVSDCDGASGSLSLSSVIPTDDGGQSTVVVTPPTATSQAASGSETPTNDDDDGPVLLEIEKKKFRLAVERWKLFSQNNGAALLPFDEEPALFTSPRMYEQPRIFAPTYPFEEDNSKGAMYMPTRCPAWCDRILMTAAGQSMVTRAQAPPIYDSFSKSICVGDHKPVLLAFSLPPMVFYESSV